MGKAFHRGYGKDEVKTCSGKSGTNRISGTGKVHRNNILGCTINAADGVKRAFPEARIGGPSVAGPGWDKAAAWLEKFLQHCAEGKNYVTGKKAPFGFHQLSWKRKSKSSKSVGADD
jgi:hypothetical protein